MIRQRFLCACVIYVHSHVLRITKVHTVSYSYEYVPFKGMGTGKI